MPDSSQDPTAGYKAPPTGPNFGLVVALACVAFLIILVAAVLLVRSKGGRIAPHPQNPAPNSMSLPAGPVHGLAQGLAARNA